MPPAIKSRNAEFSSAPVLVKRMAPYSPMCHHDAPLSRTTLAAARDVFESPDFFALSSTGSIETAPNVDEGPDAGEEIFGGLKTLRCLIKNIKRQILHKKGHGAFCSKLALKDE